MSCPVKFLMEVFTILSVQKLCSYSSVVADIGRATCASFEISDILMIMLM